MFRLTITSLAFLLALTCLGCEPGFAQEDPWAPPEPSPEELDWIKISSGEWLRGTIDLMRDEVIYFDSKEFDDVTIDWEDIAEIRSPRPMTYVMLDGSTVVGTSAFKDNLLKIDTVDGVREIPRYQILAILEGKPSELNAWSAKIGADLSILTGNTNQDDFNSMVFLKREGARSRIDIKFQSYFSQTNDVQTVNNNRATAELKWFLSRRFFVSPIKYEYYNDKFQNIDSRNTIGMGLGYYLVRAKKTDWYVELGYSYQDTRYDSVQEGEADTETNGTVPFRTTLETHITKRIELTAEYGVQVPTSSDANTLQHTYILLEFEIWKDFEIDTSLTYDHNSDPKTNEDGITPLKDDVAFYFGLSLNF